MSYPPIQGAIVPSSADRGRRGAKASIFRGLRAAILIAGVLGCLVTPLAAASAKQQNAKFWMGKNIGQAVKALGQPTQMVPIIETGGAMYIYAKKNERHMVFETGPDGVISKAVNVQ
ncbi:MAG TPA: hypothetical protein VKV28_16725 [Candidatus Binataceae bacterium]|nr:hypothetical protein [Candidatus Binataceae bacterium]